MAGQVWCLLFINIIHIRFQTVAEKNYSCYDPSLILTGKLIAFQHQVDELIATVQVLRTELKEAQTANKQLNTTIQALGAELEESKVSKEEFNRTVRTLGTDLEKATFAYKELNRTVADLGQNKELNTSAQNCLASGWSRGNATNVSFSVRLGHNKIYTGQETLVFKEIINNDGDAYNTNTGIFTAPVDGKYWFSVSIAVYFQAFAEVRMMKNSNYTVVALSDRRGYSNDNYETAAVSTVINLKSGDTVYCKWEDGTTLTYSVYGSGINTFSGALLAQY